MTASIDPNPKFFIQEKNGSFYLSIYPVWLVVYIYQKSTSKEKALEKLKNPYLSKEYLEKGLNSTLIFYKKHQRVIDSEIKAFENRPSEIAQFFTHPNKDIREITKYIFNNFEHYFYAAFPRFFNLAEESYICAFKNPVTGYYNWIGIQKYSEPVGYWYLALYKSQCNLVEVIKSLLEQRNFIFNPYYLTTDWEKIRLFSLEELKNTLQAP